VGGGQQPGEVLLDVGARRQSDHQGLNNYKKKLKKNNIK
jgi:hypothetical protein